MRIILDTNVVVSGVFFGGVPGRILEAWRDGRVTLVVSPAVLDEYQRVGRALADRYEGVELEPFLALVAVHADVVATEQLSEQVCPDPDDDKFLACALAAATPIVISGDSELRGVSGWQGIVVLSPRAFVQQYLD